jgi:hypothetical protein
MLDEGGARVSLVEWTAAGVAISIAKHLEYYGQAKGCTTADTCGAAHERGKETTAPPRRPFSPTGNEVPQKR